MVRITVWAFRPGRKAWDFCENRASKLAPKPSKGPPGRPGEVTVNDGVPKREEVVEVGVNGIARRECASHVSAASLVRQDPEVEFGEEAGEVGEGDGRWGREGFDPERGAYLNWVFFEE
ncbi:hypothetical protein FNV43_RR07212 [Rhamnella rubrinervis]|uniref:Uncharacterized protein n=1 Tax=Rhamnella rubrinervis TaxID=2594499 RepID=A0A8K0HG61_9ROSA|nr:hypothetical protein FNV43_RR07212 [Rhamnella rubrinervis]